MSRHAAARAWHVFTSIVLPAGTDDGPSPITGSTWRWVLRSVNAAFALLAALAVVDVLTEDTATATDRQVGLITIGVIVLAYVFAGRVSLINNSRVLAVVYLVVIVLGIGVLARVAPGTLFLFFIVYPQVWFLVERPRPGAFWTILLLVTSVTGLTLRPSETTNLVGVIAGQAVGVAFSLLLGGWISMLFDRSRQQARLIEQLERAKAEVSALERERGAAAERERMARDVHDTLAQGYTSILMLARTAMAQLEADPRAARERLDLVEEVAEENLAQARALVAAQSPVELDGTSLRDALSRLAQRFSRETGIEVDVRFVADSPDDEGAPGLAATTAAAGTSGLRPADELILLRATQEALTNARRHASPKRVALTLQLSRQGEATVRVVDDGVGFPAGAQPGSGLTGLRRRLEEAGGALEVTSSPGNGTELVARLVGAR